MTVLDLISASLRKLGVLGAGETCPSSDSGDALVALNNLIDQLLTIERLGIYTTTRTTWTITSGQRDYTIGTAAANALYNGDFESGTYSPVGGTSDVPNGWDSSGPGAVTTVTNPVHTAGGHALRITAGTAGAAVYVWQNVEAANSQSWSLSEWTRNGATGRSDVYVKSIGTGLYLQANLISWAASRISIATQAGTATYGELTADFDTETAGVTELQLQLEGSGTTVGDLNYFDDVSLSLLYNINLARPSLPEAIRVGYIDTSLTTPAEIPLNLLTEDGWANVMMKDFESNYPQQVYYNPTFPNGMLSLWPTPTSSSLTGVIYVPTPVGQYTTINETVSLPPGYLRMLIANLALEMAPDYEKSPHPALIEQARDSKAAIKRANHRLTDMSFDAGSLIGNGGGWFNPWTGS